MALSSVTLGGLSLTSDEYGLLTIGGWGSPKGTLSPVQKPRQHGAWAGWSYLEPRPIVLTGDAVGASDDDAMLLADALIAAASLDGATLAVTEGALTRHATVRRDGEVIIQWQPGSQRIFSWSIQLVALDPRKLGDELTGSTRLPSTTGGLTFPVAFPLTFSATTVSGQVTLTNPGNMNGPVRLRISGPCTGPVITHVGSGAALAFASSLVLGFGEWLDVDMEARTALANGQSSRSSWVTSRGWSAFEPGGNTWAFTAAGYSPSSLLTVWATPAWM